MRSVILRHVTAHEHLMLLKFSAILEIFQPLQETSERWLLHLNDWIVNAALMVCFCMFVLQVLYFPDRWWHATLNLDTSVFISTFLG